MIQQLVMYEEELQQINRICEILHRDSNAKAVLVIDKNGQAIAQAGDTQQLDVTSLSSLTAGNVAATGGIAQLLAELTVVLDVMVKKSALGVGQPSVFSEITDDDIDNLFND